MGCNVDAVKAWSIAQSTAWSEAAGLVHQYYATIVRAFDDVHTLIPYAPFQVSLCFVGTLACFLDSF
jgi:hypothetical protein